MKTLLSLICIACLLMLLAPGAQARDVRIDNLISQGKVTEADVAAAEMEGPNNWMGKGHDIYIGGYVQPWAKYMDGADPDSAFGVHRARIRTQGMLGDNWWFVIESDFANNADLTDVGVGYNVGDGAVKFGQFKVPFLYENMTYSNQLDTISRAELAGELPQRDLGVFGEYTFLEGKLGIQAAVTNGEGANATELNSQKDWYVRVAGNPFQGSENPAEGLMIAGAYLSGSTQIFDEEGLDLGDYDGDGWVATVSWTWEQIKVQAEYVDATQELPIGERSGDGWYVLGSYDLPMESVTVIPVVKYETIDSNMIDENGDWITLGVVVAFIGRHDLKLEVNYVMEDLDVGEDIDEFILQVTASF